MRHEIGRKEIAAIQRMRAVDAEKARAARAAADKAREDAEEQAWCDAQELKASRRFHF